ncbi:MAG: T9SS type A sorting domain-containing protein, partial [Bacteroidales bacterium]|nr:T9SS type A sorting domain-containing protein [Bacteroidales bacterium]
SLGTLQPGMGLMYKSNNGSAVTLVYPNGGTRTDRKANQTTGNNHWQPDLNAYPDNMSVTAIVELDGSELRSERYELAAFANGECRGSARLLYIEPLDRYMAFLTIAGDEAAELRFGLYNTETGAVETQNFASLRYETNAVVGSFESPYVVSFRSTTGVDEWAGNLQVYPNPVERGQTVSLGMTDVETSRATSVEIIDALGVVVETHDRASLPAPKVAGIYTLRITVEGKGTCFRRLVVE